MQKSLIFLILFCAVAGVRPLSAQPMELPNNVRAFQKPLAPEPVAILAMVRSTLVAVDQANKTGNYTVLRDLAGPKFHAANNAAALAQIFNALTSQNIDLLATTVVDPEYKSPPTITTQNMLYIAGTFPIAPRPVNFELLFEMESGRWRLFGVSITPAS
jgi:hypothetical protein